MSESTPTVACSETIQDVRAEADELHKVLHYLFVVGRTRDPLIWLEEWMHGGPNETAELAAWDGHTEVPL